MIDPPSADVTAHAVEMLSRMGQADADSTRIAAEEDVAPEAEAREEESDSVIVDLASDGDLLREFAAEGREHLAGAPDIKMLQPVVAGDPDKGQLRK